LHPGRAAVVVIWLFIGSPVVILAAFAGFRIRRRNE